MPLLSITVKILKHCLLVCIAQACLSVWVQAQELAHDRKDYISARAYWIDKTGKATIEQAIGQSYTTTKNNPYSIGYSESALWLKLTLAPSAQALVLFVLPAFNDDVRLYSQQEKIGTWQEQRGGDLTAYALRERGEINTTFNLQAHPAQTSEHYLRISGRNTVMAYVMAVPESRAHQMDMNTYAIIGAVWSLSIVMMAFCLARYFVRRDILWLVHAMTLLVSALLLTSQMGFVARYFLPYEPALADKINNPLVYFSFFWPSLFFWILMRSYRAAKWIQMIFLVPVVVLPLMLYLFFWGDVRWALRLNMYMLLGQAAVGSIATWFVAFKDKLEAWLLRSIYFFIILLVLVGALQMLGLIPSTLLIVYPSLQSIVVFTFLLTFGLQRREYATIEDMRINEARSRDLVNLLQWEKKRRQESDSFMSMLLHELNTPLASIRLAAMSLAQGRIKDEAAQQKKFDGIQQYISDISAVLERAREADKLDQGALSIQPVHCDAAEILQEVIDATHQQDRIYRTCPDELPVYADAQMLRLIFKNLLDNALAYSAENSPVSISMDTMLDKKNHASSDMAPSKMLLMMRITNKVGAAGVPDSERLFSKYYRSAGAHSSTGTGLGLYWVRGVLQAMGGHIECRAAAQEVTFEMVVPG